MRPPRVVIVGGGLAGMTIAKELRKRNVPAIILESAGRLGGKAGADLRDGIWIEHGYHVFPGWYRNVRALLREIGAYQDLVDLDRFQVLVRNGYPRYSTFHQFWPPTNAIRNVFSGLIDWRQLALSFYFVIDIQSQPWRYRGFLDHLSVNGFLNSRFYASDEIAEFLQYTALQASSIPNYELSTMSSQQVARAWMSTLAPLFSILNGNLQEKFITPFERQLRQAGTEIHLNTRVTRLSVQGGRIAGVLGTDDRPPLASDVNDLYVLATPPEVALRFVDADVYAAEHAGSSSSPEVRLADLVKLESVPMAALHLLLNRRIPDIPAVHVNLQGSRFGLSFIDVSQHWAGLPNTTLSIIASDFAPLAPLPESQMEHYLLEEIGQYVPIQRRDVEKSFLQSNLSAPLFINSVGSWHFRPGARTRIPNLYVAGDYCRSEADLTTMESAVISALNTTRAILGDLGDSHPGPLPLDLYPRWLAALWKFGGLPFVIPLGLWNFAGRMLRRE
jgi:phytoene dehydrogenase-like protein